MVADFRVSWHHAELRPARGRWALADLGSSNGSYADGRRADLIEIDGTARSGWVIPKTGRCSTARCFTRPAGQARRIGRVPDNDIVVPDPSVSGTTPSCTRRRAGTASWTWAATTAPSSTSSGSRRRRWPRGTPSASATPRSGWPATSCSRSPTRRQAQMPPAPDPVTDSIAETGIGAAAGPARPGRGAAAARRRDPVRGPLAGAAGRAVRELRHPERQRHPARLLPPVRPHLRGRDPGQEMAAGRGLGPRTARRGGGGRGAVRQAGGGDQLLRPARQLPRRRPLGDRRRRRTTSGSAG